jgi:hypothetical protein
MAIKAEKKMKCRENGRFLGADMPRMGCFNRNYIYSRGIRWVQDRCK